MKSRSDRNKTINYILTSLILLLSIVVALVVFSAKNGERITDENREYLVDNTKQIAESIDAALSDGYSNIRVLSELVSKSLTEPEFDITDIQGLIQDSVFDFMEFADKDGMDHNITGGVSDATDRKYYLDAKAGNTGMELIYVSRATHETLLMFYSPIYYKDQFVGSLVGVYQAANRITHLLSAEYFGEKATTYLATEEGRVIASDEGFDPQQEMYVSDLSEGNSEKAARLQAALGSGETMTFSYEDNATGGCIQKLPKSGWFVIQIFPKAASNRMIAEANRLCYMLVAFLIIVWIIAFVSLIVFYRHQRKQVEKAKEKADEANRAKTTFLFNMSHDIRTPMNAIIGYTAMAKKHSDNPQVGDYLGKIDVSGKQLLALVNQVLEMSRIESGKITLTEDPVDLVERADMMRTVISADCNAKNIKFTVDTSDIEHRNVFTDDSRMTQIVTNILGNAVKYTQEGGSIHYSTSERPCDQEGYGLYDITVRDTGIGMSEEFQNRIFDEFSRENTSTVSNIQGTSLGMSIVKRIVDIMGGTIDIKSKLGEGTAVTITVPMKWNTNGVTSSESDTKKKAISLLGKRILLVEDNEMNREIATEILEEAGVIVETAEDGDVALEILRGIAEAGDYKYYDAVLMDIQMPRMNGYEATKAIRDIAVPDGIRLPVIALSANAFEEDRQKSIEAGMDDHVAKPINVQQLKETLAKYL